MFNKLSRFLMTVAGTIIGYCFGSLVYMLAASTYANGAGYAENGAQIGVPVCFAVMCGALFYVFAPDLRNNWNRMGNRLERDIARVPISVLVSGVIGLILGLIIAYLISTLFRDIQILYLGIALTSLTYMLFGCLGVVVGTRAARTKIDNVSDDKKNSFWAAFMGRGKSSKDSQDVAVPKIFDTSVLIDGRIVDVMKTGFIEGKIIIPEYVLTELRHLSDSADTLKKARGRRGLQILKDIQSYYGIEIYNTYTDKDFDGADEVDVKLLKLAQKIGGKVVTNDFNLIQVAEIQEIPVLNINDVVKALKPVVIPGEFMTLHVVKEGRENNQGVAYMDDGTMIVVEGGKNLIGKFIEAEVTSVLQTASGRMIFAKPKR